MPVNHTQGPIQRFEFSIVVSQLFLCIGLLGLATALEHIQEAFSFQNFFISIMKFLVTFLSFGMSLYYSFSAMKARPKKPLSTQNENQEG